jgi:hypothetical protein
MFSWAIFASTGMLALTTGDDTGDFSRRARPEPHAGIYPGRILWKHPPSLRIKDHS